MRIFGTDLGNYGMLGVDLFLGLDVLVQKKNVFLLSFALAAEEHRWVGIHRLYVSKNPKDGQFTAILSTIIYNYEYLRPSSVIQPLVLAPS